MHAILCNGRKEACRNFILKKKLLAASVQKLQHCPKKAYLEHYTGKLTPIIIFTWLPAENAGGNCSGLS